MSRQILHPDGAPDAKDWDGLATAAVTSHNNADGGPLEVLEVPALWCVMEGSIPTARSVNRRLLDTIGLAAEAIVGHPIDALCAGGVLAEDIASLVNLLTTSAAGSVRLRRRTDLGYDEWDVGIQGTAARSAPRGHLLRLRPVRGREALSGPRLARLVDSATGGLVVCENNGAIVWANTAFAEMVRVDSSTLDNLNITQIFDHDNQEDLTHAIEAVIQGSTVEHVRLELAAELGSSRWLEFSIRLDAYAHMAGVVMTARDVSAEVSEQHIADDRRRLGEVAAEISRLALSSRPTDFLSDLDRTLGLACGLLMMDSATCHGSTPDGPEALASWIAEGGTERDGTFDALMLQRSRQTNSWDGPVILQTAGADAETPADTGDPQGAHLLVPMWVRSNLVGYLVFSAADAAHPWREHQITFTTRLAESVSHVLVQHRLDNEILERETQLRYVADHDPLTGLANRSQVDRFIQELIQSGASECVIAIADLDGFKAVNDTHGHAAGDAVLKAVARWLLESVPPDTLVGRVGGDEFLLISTCRDDESVAAIVGLEEGPCPDVDWQGNRLRFGLSLGAARGAPSHIRELQLRADEAMYSGKARKRAHGRVTPD